MKRRLLGLMVGALVLSLGAVSPVHAGQYPEPSVGFEDLGNGLYRIFGTGCQAGETVVITSEPGDATATGTADDDGAFSIEIFLSEDPGTYTLTVTCGDLVQQLTIEVEVLGSEDTQPTTTQPPTTPGEVTPSASGGGPATPSPSGGGGSLAFTGGEPWALVRFAAVALAAGAVLRYFAQRRRASRAATH